MQRLGAIAVVFVARTETPVTIEVEGVGANGISTLQPHFGSLGPH